MKSLFILLLVSGATIGTAFGRLGDTEEQAQGRYGLQKIHPPVSGAVPLVQGARELTFEYEGWKIRSALLRATDGQEYIVREEYTKLPNGKAMQKTGFLITDYERDSILQAEAEGRTWHQKMIGDVSPDPLQLLANQIAHVAGLGGKIWIREDGAIVRGLFGYSMILELPQASKYEAELKIIKDREAKASVPKF